jgi:hypothetical protein
MVYTFSCPLPCNRVIKVDANNDDDAVIKIITAGAIRCRSIMKSSCQEKHTNYLPPLNEKNLKEIVMFSMYSE